MGEAVTFITSVELTPELAKIHTITPKGIPLINEYSLPEYRELKLDHKGNLEIKKKERNPKLKKALRTAERIGIFAVGFYLGSRMK